MKTDDIKVIKLSKQDKNFFLNTISAAHKDINERLAVLAEVEGRAPFL